MEKVFIATVQIAVTADTQSEACDAFSGMLSENLKECGALIDWQYATVNGELQEPKEKGIFYVSSLEEGELFL